MLRAMMLTCFVLMIFGFGSTMAADCPKKSATFITVDQHVNMPSAKGLRASCTLFKHNPDDSLLGFTSGYDSSQATVTYFDPAECDTAAYPFEITGLSFTLLDPPATADPRPYKWPVLLDVVVFDLADSADSCSGPGAELCRISLVCDSVTYAFPEVATVSFSTPCCVEGPFFIGIDYTDPGPGLLPSVLYDVNSVPDTCHIFQQYYGQWWDWYEYWVIEPGYPFYWVHGETVSLNCCVDLDSDGICEGDDNCLLDYNPGQEDGDNDGVGDVCDNCPDDYNPGQEDTDGDGFADACDNCPEDFNGSQQDSDSDGVGDVCDNCLFLGNPLQEDADLDDVGDSCDTCTDTDGDGYGNPIFPANTCSDDNCPYAYNPGQEDADSNGVGDACDIGCCVDPVRGNVNGDVGENVNIADLTYIVDYLFKGGNPPGCFEEADCDGSGPTNIADLTYLVDYLFGGGPQPVSCP